MAAKQFEKEQGLQMLGFPRNLGVKCTGRSPRLEKRFPQYSAPSFH